MAEYRPIGSEKLRQDDKLKRILELTYYNNGNNQQKKNTQSEYLKESINGGVYAIIKEKDGYYVKRGLNENSLDYIGGMFMKNKNRFNSYAEAVKRMELLVGNEQLQEATKYVLKKETPKQEAPTPEPAMDMPPMSPEGGETPPMSPEGGEMPPMSPEGGEEMGASKRSDYMAEIQKYAGKLGQELRDQKDKMESDDIKYVLNMVISAVDLDKLELEDLEEIGEKFERDEEEGYETEMPPSEEMPAPEVETEPETETTPESDLGEEDAMLKLEKFVKNNSYDTNEDVDFEKYAMKEMDDLEEDVVELDMNEIRDQISKSVNDTLSKYFK
jgi:hypothetical protein